jgi:hypothetical protein
VIEQIQLTGTAGLKKVDDAFGPRRKLGRVRRQRVGGRRRKKIVVAQKRSQGQRAQAHAALAEK